MSNEKLEIDSRIPFVKIRPGMNILYFDIKGVRTMKTTDLKTEKINTVTNVVKSSENCPKTLKRLNVYG